MTRSAKGRSGPSRASSRSAGEGLIVARYGGEAVTDDYSGDRPWAFVGGTIERVFVDVSGDPFVDLAREAAALFARE